MNERRKFECLKNITKYVDIRLISVATTGHTDFVIISFTVVSSADQK